MQNLSSLATSANAASPSVIGAIRQASAESGVDFSYLMQKAATESSFNPTAKSSTSSASGLYQFIDQTWLTEMSSHGAEFGLAKEAAAISVDDGHVYVADPAMRSQILALKNDPKVAAEMAAAFTKENQTYLQNSVGGHIGGTELYLAHFLGAGGATKFLTAMKQNPGQSGASVMPAAADANEPVFYHADGSARSLGEIYNHFAARFNGTSVASTTPAASATTTSSYSTFASLAFSSSSTGSTAAGLDNSDFQDPGRASLYEMLVLSQLSNTEQSAAGEMLNSSKSQSL